MKTEVLYVFGGEKAQGAEIVIERLMEYNVQSVNAHLFISPGKFADELLAANKSYKINCLRSLKKLNRGKTTAIAFYFKALINYVKVSASAYRYIKANKIYTIHANTIVPASYLLPLIVFSRILLPGRKWIWSDHDMNYFSSLDLFLAKYCVRFYDCTLVVSNAVKHKYQADNKLQVLYNGLDMDKFTPDEVLRVNYRKALNITDDTIVFGIAASISPGKGQLMLIETFTRLAKSYTNMCLVIAGNFGYNDLKYNDEVRKSIAGQPKINYVGFVDNMLAFYNGCDVVISNSDLKHSESLGTTIYEALSCRKIVVASKTGGTPEIITDRVDGYLFDADNPRALEEVLKSLLESFNSNDRLLDQMKDNAQEKVNQRFNIYKMIAKYNQILAELSGHLAYK